MDQLPPKSDFENAVQGEAAPSLASEFWEFLRHNKKWWLLPILIVLLIFGVLIFLAGTGAAPFIYTFH
jgi:drug/metabolite transporter superfamily protein YnfA